MSREEFEVSGHGATRSGDVEHLAFSSLPTLALIGLARVAGEGRVSHGPNNHMRGLYAHKCYDHGMAHAHMARLGDRTEEHLLKAAWNFLKAWECLQLDPEMNKPFWLGPGATVTPEMAAYLDDFRAKRLSGEYPKADDWTADEIKQVQRILKQRAERLSESTEKRP